MTETAEQAPAESIGAEQARELAGRAYAMRLDCHMRNSPAGQDLNSLWDALRTFATPTQVAIQEALDVERGNGYGLTPPEVVALPREVQIAVEQYRTRHASNRNNAQAAYELRTRAEGLTALRARKAQNAVQHEAGLPGRAAALGVGVATLRGAELLDRQLPGWAQFIDTGRLDMSSFDQCILGQLGGRHEKLQGIYDYSRVHDYLVLQDPATMDHFLNFGTCGHEWVKLVQMRVAADALAAE